MISGNSAGIGGANATLQGAASSLLDGSTVSGTTASAGNGGGNSLDVSARSARIYASLPTLAA